MNSPARVPVVKAGEIVEGRYRIVRVLDQGGMGTVFLAEHVLIKRRVAIKILHQELAGDAEVIERFMNEASAAGTLGHSNIVESIDMGFTRNDVPFIVFEYLEGALLTDEIYRVGGLTVRRALKITNQIASALEAAHAANIIHRDLKSDNVFLIEKDGSPDHVKVLDFGVSRFLEAETEATRQKKLMVGTPEFMAPEQILTPDKVDARADIYALGVLLYEMLTARRPFKNEGDTEALLRRIVREPPPPMSRSDAPPGLQEMLFNSLLAKDPDKRYRSMKEVQGAIAAFSGILRPTGTLTPQNIAAVQGLGAATPTPYPTPLPAPMPEPSDSSPSLPQAAQTIAPAVQQVVRRSPTPWLIGALVVGLAGVGSMFIVPTKVTSSNEAAKLALQGEADTIASALDAAASSTRLRAEGIATSPMLRAAIETDAATVKDMLRDSDFVFTPKKDEILELFQLRGGKTTSMMRIPETAPSLVVAGGDGTQVITDGSGIVLVAAVPVTARNGKVGGTLAISAPVDLASIKQSASERSLQATLVGLDKPLVLYAGTGTPTGADVRIPVKVNRDLATDLALVALIAPPTSTEVDRFKIVRFGAWGVGGALLLIYLMLLLRTRT